MTRRRIGLVVVVLVAALGALAPIGPASGAPDGNGGGSGAESPPVDALFAPGTGAFTFLRAPAGRVLAPVPPGRSAGRAALDFLAERGAALGLSAAERGALAGRRGAGGSRLRVERVDRDHLGMSHVRLAQTYRGLPVFGGQLTVHLNRHGVVAVNGSFVPGVAVDARPAVDAVEAGRVAKAAVAKSAPGVALEVAGSRLQVLRTGLLEGRAGENRLVHAVEVEGRGVRDQVFVDATSGGVVGSVSRIHRALDRCVYSPQYDADNPELFRLRSEGSPPSLVPPVDNLYDFAGHTYHLFANAFGRDSFDGAGQKMVSVYLVDAVCPNAYWNGASTNYCPAFDVDDVVAHEWGHAYTQHTSDLIYAYQAGALNESYSDIWGEVVDLLNAEDGIGGSDNNAPYPQGQRWLVGEDLGQPVQELLLRDMWDPERLGLPAKVSSPNYYCDSGDQGGVHYNSSVPNHAFAMLVDGKTFNGETVTGIGLTRAAHVYWRANALYQTSTTNFAGHAHALRAACTDLIGSPLNGLSTVPGGPALSADVIDAGHCAQVEAAIRAVELEQAPTQCDFEPQLRPGAPAVCEGATTALVEDFEDGLAGWSMTSEGLFPEWPGYTWTSQATLPDGRTGTAAFAPNLKDGTCAPGGDHSGRYTLDSPEVTLPASGTPTLRFDHYVETETNYDGGNVAVSVNGTPFRVLPASAYVFNGPERRLASPPPLGQNTNPKAGENAWHGTDEGEVTGSWGTTIADLSGVAGPGDTVRIRFDFGIDGCNGLTGWFVDDVQVYACSGAPAAVRRS